MAKRLNLRNRECPKCGGKIGIIRRATSNEPLQMLGCVSNGHVQVQGTYGYHPDDFPKKRKQPTEKEVNKFIAGIRYPSLAAFAVNKVIAKFGLTREQAVAAYQRRKVSDA